MLDIRNQVAQSALVELLEQELAIADHLTNAGPYLVLNASQGKASHVRLDPSSTGWTGVFHSTHIVQLASRPCR